MYTGNTYQVMATNLESGLSRVMLRRQIFLTELGEAESSLLTGVDAGYEGSRRRLSSLPVAVSRQLALGRGRALQSTLLLRAQRRLNTMSEDSKLERVAFQRQMLALQARQAGLTQKRSGMRQKVANFEPLLKDTEMKRRRSLNKCRTERTKCLEKDHELERLKSEVSSLQERRDSLVRLIEKQRVYEQYLARSVDRMPEICAEGAAESPIGNLITRYETVRQTNLEAKIRSEKLSHEYSLVQQKLNMHSYSQAETIVNYNHRLAEAQETLAYWMKKNLKQKERIAEAEATCRENCQMFGQIILAIENIREQCIRPGQKPLKPEVNALDQLQRIEEFLLERTAVLELVRKLDFISFPSRATPPISGIKAISREKMTRQRLQSAPVVSTYQLHQSILKTHRHTSAVSGGLYQQ